MWVKSDRGVFCQPIPQPRNEAQGIGKWGANTAGKRKKDRLGRRKSKRVSGLLVSYTVSHTVPKI